MIDELIALGGSLIAVAVMAGVALALRLGGGTIADEAEAIAAAEAALPGFEGTRAALGSDGRAAIVTGADGSIALLKMHGSQVAARRLSAPIDARETPDGLVVATGETRFGAVTVRGAGFSGLA